ncbi:hypothetical protein SCHPADRAFT_1000128 [Schizopora paradoxa]|uniref:Uncharacterized protein n=1 Tax=Schizopora paradoxa TaxID=27342 RepID=A0A0H2RCW2_9AGAM|nr:hypothetical protein SCHPADRAFT_1000128 [Schizopora paradoxa]
MTFTIRDEEFYKTLVTFKVENVLFRVPEDDFKDRSEVFRDMFSIPQATVFSNAVTSEGYSDSNPIILEGVKADDFRALLRHLYAKKYANAKELSKSEWIGIHALAHMWGFDDARKESKETLSSMHDSVTKFELGTRFDYDDWIRKAYEELCARLEPLTVDEAKRIGLEAAIHISRLREHRCKSMASPKAVKASQHNSGFDFYVDRDREGSCQCPYCSTVVKKEADTTPSYPSAFNSVRNNGAYGRKYPCSTCNITLLGECPSAAEIVSKEISDEIHKLIPPKTSKPTARRIVTNSGRRTLTSASARVPVDLFS